MKRVLKEVFDLGLYLLVVLLITYIVVTYVCQRVEVDGDSMNATLRHGDNLIVDKLSYRFHDPERFDVVIFPFQQGEAKKERVYFIKRIIGLPGEMIQIDSNGVIFINGKPIYESYGMEVIRPENIGLASEPIILGEDEYFVLGDNRNGSMDSRFSEVGNIPRKNIIGKAWIRIWPFNKFGVIKHS